MSFLCPSPPPAPDYAAAASAQGAANVDAARTTTWLNNPTQITPSGSRTVTADPNIPDHMIQYDTLNPAEQHIHDLVNYSSTGALTALGDYGIPAIRSALQRGYSLPGSAATDFAPGNLPPEGFQYNPGDAGPIQRGLNFSGAPGMPQANAGVRDQVSRSIYDQGARFLDPRFAREQSQVDTKLSNQGIFRGGAGYDDAQRQLADERTQAYGDLQNRAVTGGGDAMQQLFGMQMGARQQGVGEIGQQGAFANQAQGQGFQQLMDAMAGRNAAVGAQYGVAGQRASLANSGRAQNFQEMVQAGTLPVNIMNALMSSGQISSPNFSPFSSSANVAPAPIFAGAQAQGQSNINSYNAQQAGLGNWLNAGSRIGAAAMMPPFSDRRLKSDVVRIGITTHGIPIYEYTIFGRREKGVMADEVLQIVPEAVHVDAQGFQHVDYSRLGLGHG